MCMCVHSLCRAQRLMSDVSLCFEAGSLMNIEFANSPGLLANKPEVSYFYLPRVLLFFYVRF